VHIALIRYAVTDRALKESTTSSAVLAVWLGGIAFSGDKRNVGQTCANVRHRVRLPDPVNPGVWAGNGNLR
jgi:hypothetical protein